MGICRVGAPRTNSQRPQIKKQIDSYESEIQTAQEEKKKIPEKVMYLNGFMLLKMVRSVVTKICSLNSDTYK